MADICVTVPKSFGLDTWIEEGDLPGEPWSGMDSHFYLGYQAVPDVAPGERVYVVYNGAIRGYAPLVRIERIGHGFALVRRGGAVAVTIPEYVRGFRGWRYRWWDLTDEVPFPEWTDADAVAPGLDAGT